MEKEYIYMYYDAAGHAMYSPNRDLALYRAKVHGTHSVYVFEV